MLHSFYERVNHPNVLGYKRFRWKKWEIFSMSPRHRRSTLYGSFSYSSLRAVQRFELAFSPWNKTHINKSRVEKLIEIGNIYEDLQERENLQISYCYSENWPPLIQFYQCPRITISEIGWSGSEIRWFRWSTTEENITALDYHFVVTTNGTSHLLLQPIDRPLFWQHRRFKNSNTALLVFHQSVW